MAATLGGRRGASAYAATKGAVDAFTKGFAREVAAEGIRVNAIRARAGADGDDGGTAEVIQAFLAAIAESLPMQAASARRPEIAEAMLWLLSDEASFITGAMLDASGGGYII